MHYVLEIAGKTTTPGHSSIPVFENFISHRVNKKAYSGASSSLTIVTFKKQILPNFQEFEIKRKMLPHTNSHMLKHLHSSKLLEKTESTYVHHLTSV